MYGLSPVPHVVPRGRSGPLLLHSREPSLPLVVTSEDHHLTVEYDAGSVLEGVDGVVLALEHIKGKFLFKEMQGVSIFYQLPVSEVKVKVIAVCHLIDVGAPAEPELVVDPLRRPASLQSV